MSAPPEYPQGQDGRLWNPTRSTQDTRLGLFTLPQEIRHQIYENVITYTGNFIYRSQAQIKEAREEHGVRHTVRRNKALKKFRAKDGPCSITFEIAPFPKFIDGNYDTTSLLLVSKRFSEDIKLAARHIKLKVQASVSRCLTGVNPYSRFWSEEYLTPYAIAIIQSSRHIFAGYGHNTTTTARLMPETVAHNITNIFLTAFVFSYSYTRNWGEAPPTFSYRSVFPGCFTDFLECFPNADTLAFACGPHGKAPMQIRNHYLLQFVMNAFQHTVSIEHNLKFLEMVYQQEEKPSRRESHMTKWASGIVNTYIKSSNGVRVSEIELEGRGRYWSEYEHITDKFQDTLVEERVWRISKENAMERKGTASTPQSGLVVTTSPDFQDPFADLCATEIFTEVSVDTGVGRTQQPIPWHEKCSDKSCDCGNGCGPYTRHRPPISPNRSH
ncbi:hypothetical protein TWF481_010922 [Arthrobotrys musiformis]|uniref:Uncharacterized protein n=1 Tax=Arthrobotrys musiformis TaxID=47236 RepID=A0AAV9VY91_9PEZI